MRTLANLYIRMPSKWIKNERESCLPPYDLITSWNIPVSHKFNYCPCLFELHVYMNKQSEVVGFYLMHLTTDSSSFFLLLFLWNSLTPCLKTGIQVCHGRFENTNNVIMYSCGTSQMALRRDELDALMFSFYGDYFFCIKYHFTTFKTKVMKRSGYPHGIPCTLFWEECAKFEFQIGLSLTVNISIAETQKRVAMPRSKTKENNETKNKNSKKNTPPKNKLSGSSYVKRRVICKQFKSLKMFRQIK